MANFNGSVTPSLVGENSLIGGNRARLMVTNPSGWNDGTLDFIAELNKKQSGASVIRINNQEAALDIDRTNGGFKTVS